MRQQSLQRREHTKSPDCQVDEKLIPEELNSPLLNLFGDQNNYHYSKPFFFFYLESGLSNP